MQELRQVSWQHITPAGLTYSQPIMSTYGPYSPIRKAGSLFFISGQVGINAEIKVAAADIEGQTRQALDNLKQLLEDNGLDINNTVKTTIFLKNMDDFTAMNEVYLRYFKEPRPARSTVEVAGLPKLADNELLIEIEAVVYKP